ncbi:hypothetical protein Q31a_25610 [Aureliella helgolandensis]|uniref:Uncharacterized protein n=1 Tax=Aureliella helgolandensis TaxID=2527968 RepID=A0A518G6N9_9BACT|nr:hypothetical protein Q31a_25610 [Aureliella helgolandensis]
MEQWGQSRAALSRRGQSLLSPTIAFCLHPHSWGQALSNAQFAVGDRGWGQTPTSL